jgi:hypothetical protein
MLTQVQNDAYPILSRSDSLYDLIHGFAQKVIDENNFLMRVTWESPKNKCDYKNQETICISSIDAPELYHPGDSRDKEDMEWKFRGKIVKCNVKERDLQGRLVCTIVGAF